MCSFYGLFGTHVVVHIFFTFAFDIVRIVDVLCYLTIGKFPLGSAKYMIDPGTLPTEILFTLHHLWFVPLCMWVLYKNGTCSPGWFLMLLGPLGMRGLVSSFFASIALGLISRYFTPLWVCLKKLRN